MADPIDNDFFEQDIKPLRDTYGLNRRESSYITSLEDRDMQPHLQTMLRLRSQLVQERNADLAYQTGLFEFEEKRKRHGRKLIMLIGLRTPLKILVIY